MFTVSINLYSQEISNKSSDWIEYFSYHNNSQLANSPNKIFIASKNAIFYLQRSDLSIHRFSKINGLSDVGISTIACDPTGAYLIIGYDNGNIDIVNNGQTTNIVDLKTKLISSKKSINCISFLSKKAFLATPFGIVVLDYQKAQLEDTYILSSTGQFVGINKLFADTTTSTIYAATQKGVSFAKFGSSNLADFNNWTKIASLGDSSYNAVCFFNQKLYINRNSYARDSLYVYENGSKSLFKKQYSLFQKLNVSNNKLIIVSALKIDAFDTNLLLKNEIDSSVFKYPFYTDACFDSNGKLLFIDKSRGIGDLANKSYLCPESPLDDVISSITYLNNTLIITHGIPWSLTVPNVSYYFMSINYWDGWTNFGTSDQVRAAGYQNENFHYFIGTWEDGIFEYNTDISKIKNHYKQSNSLISGDMISSMNIDTANNLFVCSARSDYPFSVFTKNRQWFKWKYRNFTSVIDIGTMCIDKNNWKWTIAQDGVFVFNDKNTPLNPDDDDTKFIPLYDNSGEQIAETATTLAFDLNNVLWVGTISGLAYYSFPDQIFGDSKPILSRNKITINGVVDYLLASETILSIEIDAANRKWIGTNNGLFLINANGTEVLQHFTFDNSPLPSNYIASLKIIPHKSELLIGTFNGMISYNIDIKDARSDFSQISIYPNPVKHDFTGLIRIEGLMDNTTVKIMDIDGNLVYEAVSEGGTAFWNGNNLIGKRVASGVYVVIFVNSDQTQKKVSKIFFIH
jgi:hypothetical protein